MALELAPLISLLLLFSGFALLHASVGLGGASSYTALMVIFSVDVLLIPLVALTLNIVVSSTVLAKQITKGQLPTKTLLCLLLSSVPAAYLGGLLQVSPTVMQAVLLCALLLVALSLLASITGFIKPLVLCASKTKRLLLLLLLGAVLGFVSGVAGIGGGIYLTPLLVLLGLLPIKKAAACGCGFIFFNSCAGILGKAQQAGWGLMLGDKTWLLAAFLVFVAAGLGGHIMLKVPDKVVKKLLLLVVLLANILLISKMLG